MAFLLVFSPLAYGSVEPWAQHVVVTVACATLCIVALKYALVPSTPFVLTWAYVPIALFLGLVLVQLVSLPPGLLRWLSPQTISLREELVGPVVDWTTLSLYPYATAHQLKLLIAVIAVFVSVLNIFRSPEQIKRLLILVAAIGTGVGLLALAQNLTAATNIYWVGAIGKGDRANAGPFVHYSHYGQYANFTIGACLGLLVVTLHKQSTKKDHSTRQTAISSASVWSFVIVLAIVILVVTILQSGSRTAMSSMLAAAIFAAVCIARSRSMGGRGWFAVPMLAMAAGLVLAIGSGAALERWGSLSSAQSYAERIKIVSDLRSLWAQFPVFGTGFNTHEFVFPMVDRSNTTHGVAVHAECEYAQVLEETGAIGLILVLAFTAMVFSAVLRASRHTRPVIRIASIGLGYAVVATLIHSVADFAQHLLPNAILMAVTSAILINLSHLSRSSHTHSGSTQVWAETQQTEPAEAVATPYLPAITNYRIRRLAISLVTVGCVAITVWTSAGAARASEAHALSEQASSLRRALANSTEELQSTNDDYIQALQLAARAVEVEPSNVRHRYILNQIRWQSVSRVRNPETGDLVLTEQSLEVAARIVDELQSARSLCPTYGHLYSLASQLSISILNDPGGATDARKSFRLSQKDALAALMAAKVDANVGDWPAAESKLQRAIELGTGFEAIATTCLDGRQSEVALRLAGTDYARLQVLALLLEKRGTDAELAHRVRLQANEALSRAVADPNAPAELLIAEATALASRKQYAPSIDLYRRAISRSYGQSGWHLGLAKILAASGRHDEAIRAAKTCMMLQPNNPEATALIENSERMLRQNNSGQRDTEPSS